MPGVSALSKYRQEPSCLCLVGIRPSNLEARLRNCQVACECWGRGRCRLSPSRSCSVLLIKNIIILLWSWWFSCVLSQESTLLSWRSAYISWNISGWEMVVVLMKGGLLQTIASLCCWPWPVTHPDLEVIVRSIFSTAEITRETWDTCPPMGSQVADL